MKRALGVDYGDVRIGLAVSDGLRMLASPLETIDRRRLQQPWQRIAALAEEHDVDTVVVGLPLHLGGGAGVAVEKVRRFIGELRSALPAGVRLEEVDERLSSREATEKLLSGGRRREFSRGQIDQAAAAVILQDYLDQHQQPLLLPAQDEDRVAPWGSAEDWEEDEPEGWEDDQEGDDFDDEDEVLDDEEDDDDDDSEGEPTPPDGDWEEDDKDDLGALVDDDEEEWSEDDEDEDDWEDEDEDEDWEDEDEDEDDEDDDEDEDDEWDEDEDADDDEDEDEDEREDSRWGRVWDGFSDDD